MTLTSFFSIGEIYPWLFPVLIVLATFILEDPTTILVGALISTGKISFELGFLSLLAGVFLGDLGLYFLGLMMRRGFLKKKPFSLQVSSFTIGLARFVPGMRTVTFLSAGFSLFPLRRFLSIIFPSTIIWTLGILFFTDEVIKILHSYPTWMKWSFGIGLFLILHLLNLKRKSIKQGMKFLFFLSIIPVLLLHHGFLFLLPMKKVQRVAILLRSLSRYCRFALKILEVQVVSNLGTQKIAREMIISNHLSYLDVLCLSSLTETSYITSEEIRTTPVLGQVCQLCGCLFTERRRKFRSPLTHETEVKLISEYLKAGINIVLFPEGTSTPGDEVLPFKTSLLESGLNEGSLFRPLALLYSSREVAWYGEMTFLPHLWKLCGLEGVKAYLCFDGQLTPKVNEDRKDLGIRLREKVIKKRTECNLLVTSSELVFREV